MKRVAVIGAGAGGLSAARHLLDEGHDVVVFERGSYVGGLWVYDGDVGGRYLHSHDYREPEPFRGERVLVVGVGNSGLDIAADLAPHASRTLSAARSPVLIMPRMVLGVPTARIMGKLTRPWMPWPVQRQIMRLVSRAFHGRPEQWGMRTPRTRTHPASNATFMAHVSYRTISVKPGVAAVDGHTVRFDDGTTEDVDTIVEATGYEIDLPFLSDDVSPVRERRLDAYQRVVHPDRPGLYFVGFFNVSGGANISMMDTRSAWVAALVSGRSALPSPGRMHADIAAERRRNARRFPGTARYGLELEPARYRKRIAQEIGRVGVR